MRPKCRLARRSTSTVRFLHERALAGFGRGSAARVILCRLYPPTSARGRWSSAAAGAAVDVAVAEAAATAAPPTLLPLPLPLPPKVACFGSAASA